MNKQQQQYCYYYTTTTKMDPPTSTTTTTTTTTTNNTSASETQRHLNCTATTTTTITTTTSPVATTATASGKTKTKKTKYSLLTPQKKKQYADAAIKKKELRLLNMTPEERIADKQRERGQKSSSYYKRKYTIAMEHLKRGLVERNLNVDFGGPTHSASIFGKVRSIHVLYHVLR